MDPGLVKRDRNGKVQTVRYDAVNSMLLNEFLKEHKAFIEERQKLRKLEATVMGLVATLREQTVQRRKATIRTSKSPKVVSQL